MATVTSIDMRKGFDLVTITLDHTREDLPEFICDNAGQPVKVEMREGDVYRVSATGFYSTTQGLRAGNTKISSFRDQSQAQAKANGWFNHLKSQGYERIK